MERSEVENIFDKKKEELLSYYKNCKDDSPTAIILGGQPASGKSTLISHIENNHSNKNFLVVNGDLYRIFHPNADKLISNIDLYSKETQIFSNVFTERLIQEAAKNKYNIIIEGTMRNPKIPKDTALFFKENKYKNIQAHAIVTPSIITELGIYNRFLEEIQKKGVGRLADIDSHNSAVLGLSKSLDTLYDIKAVNKITLYNYLGEKKLKEINLKKDKWSSIYHPSYFVKKERKNQLNDKLFLEKLLRNSKKHSIYAPKNIKNRLEKVINKMEKVINKIGKSNRKGFTR